MNAHPTIRRHTISITGRPLPAPVTVDNVERDDTIHGDGWLLTAPQAARLLDAWKTAPTGNDTDVIREWVYSESGVFLTALCMDGEVSLSVWESATGSDGDDIYSTLIMPFDFHIGAAREGQS